MKYVQSLVEVQSMNVMVTHIHMYVRRHTYWCSTHLKCKDAIESRLGSYGLIGAKPWASVLPAVAGAVVGLLVPLLGCEECFWPFFCK